ncbi:DEAD/DEAH box helicase family protein [Arthrobacter alpinus]|uniref:DEAD/DEAH box helicase family protein n=1 Tax=Arthrobacter alpinus TaxID=656366 RepID=UPI001114F54E|nr:DEAD/DEAH box helicase family protein [Arthrobacter alpinus]
MLVPSGKKARAQANMAAIELMQALDVAGRYATAAEQEVLAQWSSWGAVPEIFESWREEWSPERSRLESLLSESERGAAAATTVNAHYTDPAIATAMWTALGRAGFTGGPVLEPGCGSGNFIGLAPSSARMVGVELDPVTARIASYLYPNSQVRAEGLEKAALPENSFHATIGNVPFGNFSVFDARHNPNGLNIHNYFIAKSLRLTAPGGYVAVVTSAFTMDAAGTKARREIARYGDLVGAVRLPAKAFSRVSGTEVVADVLILRRRPDESVPDEHAINAWVETATTGATHKTTGEIVDVSINKYFADHPENVLGEVIVGQGQYNELTVSVRERAGVDLAAAVESRLSAIVDAAKNTALEYAPVPAITAQQSQEVFAPGLTVRAAVGKVRVGSMRINGVGDGVERRTADGLWEAWVRPRGNKVTLTEIKALVDLKSHARAVIESQRHGAPLEDRDSARQALNVAYDNYSFHFGPINRFTLGPERQASKAHIGKRLKEAESSWRESLPADLSARERSRHDVPEYVQAQWIQDASEPIPGTKVQEHLVFLGGDADLGVLLALESFDDDTQKAKKTAVFSQDVVAVTPQRDSAESPADALAICLDEHRVVRLDRIAELLGVDEDTARERLGTLVFDEPGTGNLVAGVTYLSGNVRTKLAIARQHYEVDTRFGVNVDLLSSVMPEDIEGHEINIRPGVRYISEGDYVAFCEEVFQVTPTVSADPVDQAWEVKGPPKSKFDAVVQFQYGTDDRSPTQLLTLVMNNRSVSVKRTIEDLEGNKRQVEDVKATMEAREKANTISDAFAVWALADPDRAARIVASYNEAFNSYVQPDYTAMGEAMAFPGLGTQFNPHAYQRTAVARILNEPSCLLDHVVGAGKTGTMIMATMELRRTGIARKPWIVVPNHLVSQVAREFNEWYPMANVLPIPAGEGPDARRKWVAASAASDWDAVIAPYSVFGKIEVDPNKSKVWLEEEISELRAAKDLPSDGEKDRVRTKKLEAAIKRLEVRHEKLISNKDIGTTFEETGADYLFVDEAHNFKNLRRSSDFQELGHVGSQRASDIDYKLRSLRELKTEVAVRSGVNPLTYQPAVATFATGTPVANSMAEMWVMQRYLRPDLLAAAKLHSVDAWGNQFTRAQTRMELTPAGDSYKPVNRLVKFVNVHELLKLNQQFTSTVTSDDITAALPSIAGGARRAISRPASDQVVDYMKELAHRANNLPTDPSEDNLLKIMNDGRAAALDGRLKDLDGDEDGGRATMVAAEIIRVHNLTKDRVYTDKLGDTSPIPGGLQLVFCDRSIPRADGSFSMYEAVAAELVEAGMEREKISFIHDAEDDAAKDRLFARARAGQVSVLIGSTERMGTGTNVQLRCTAIHHMDIPWRPADIEQREGRAIRQGNQNSEVEIVNYITEGTFDQRMWSVVARKAAFIGQVKNGKLDAREVDDVSSDFVLMAGEMQALASGDERMIQYANLANDVATLESLQRSFWDTRKALTREQHQLEAFEKTANEHQRIWADVLPTLKDTSGENFSMVVAGKTLTARVEAGNALKHQIGNVLVAFRGGDAKVVPAGQLGGTGVMLRREFNGTRIEFVGLPEISVFVSDSSLSEGVDSAGLIRRMENVLGSLEEHIGRSQTRTTESRVRVDQIAVALKHEFPRQKDLDEAKAKMEALGDDLGLNMATAPDDALNLEQATEVTTLDGAELTQLYKDTASVRGRDLRVGDVVSGVGKAGTWRVTASGQWDVELAKAGASDSTDESTLSLRGNDEVVLITRDHSALNEMECMLLNVPETDLVVWDRRVPADGHQVSMWGRPMRYERQHWITTHDAEPELLTGELVRDEPLWIVTDSHGKQSRVEVRGYGQLATPVILHNVRDPEAEALEAVARAVREAEDAATLRKSDLLPGDTLLEDVPELGHRGDVISFHRYGSYSLVDPHSGMERKLGHYKPQRVKVQEGRKLAEHEIAALYENGLTFDVNELRVGDVVVSTEIDRKATIKNDVVITSVNRGGLVGIRYRPVDEPRAESTSCKRKSGADVTVLSRRYGALDNVERAKLRAPGKVTELRLRDLSPEVYGSWVGFEGYLNMDKSYGSNRFHIGQLIEVKERPTMGPRGDFTWEATVETTDGSRKRVGFYGPHVQTVLWDGDLPERPIDRIGMTLEPETVTQSSLELPAPEPSATAEPSTLAAAAALESLPAVTASSGNEVNQVMRGHAFYPASSFTEQEGLSDRQQLVREHFFLGGNDWWVTEYDQESKITTGFTVLNGDAPNGEYGDFSLEELEQFRRGLGVIERDLHWEPVTLAQARSSKYPDVFPPERSLDSAAAGQEFLDSHLSVTTVELPAPTSEKGPELTGAAATVDPVIAPRAITSSGEEPVDVLTPEPQVPAEPLTDARIVKIAHTKNGSLVTNTDKADTATVSLLKEQGFKWSARISSWYLNRGWKTETRDSRVRGLAMGLAAQGRAFAFEPAVGERLISTLTAGDLVRIADEQHLIISDTGLNTGRPLTGYGEVIGRVASTPARYGGAVEIVVSNDEREYSLRFRGKTGEERTVEVLSADQAIQWGERSSTDRAQLGVWLDRNVGVPIEEVTAGSVVSLTARTFDLETLRDIVSESFQRVTVLSTHPGEGGDLTLWTVQGEVDPAPVILQVGEFHDGNAVIHSWGDDDFAAITDKAPTVLKTTMDTVLNGDYVSVEGAAPHTVGSRLSRHLILNGTLVSAEDARDGRVEITVSTDQELQSVYANGDLPDIDVIRIIKPEIEPTPTVAAVPAQNPEPVQARATAGPTQEEESMSTETTGMPNVVEEEPVAVEEAQPNAPIEVAVNRKTNIRPVLGVRTGDILVNNAGIRVEVLALERDGYEVSLGIRRLDSSQDPQRITVPTNQRFRVEEPEPETEQGVGQAPSVDHTVDPITEATDPRIGLN